MPTIFHNIRSSPKIGVYCRQTEHIGNSLEYAIGPCPAEYGALVGNLPDNDKILVRGVAAPATNRRVRLTPNNQPA